jgi:hypothetical protein
MAAAHCIVRQQEVHVKVGFVGACPTSRESPKICQSRQRAELPCDVLYQIAGPRFLGSGMHMAGEICYLRLAMIYGSSTAASESSRRVLTGNAGHQYTTSTKRPESESTLTCNMRQQVILVVNPPEGFAWIWLDCLSVQIFGHRTFKTYKTSGDSTKTLCASE